MAVKLPNGATVAIESALATATTVTAVSNANPAVATAAGHTLVDGDIIVITSGWSDLNGRTARVTASADGVFSLEGIDTTDTARFPTGSGGGSVQKVSSWQDIEQILDTSQSGGDQQFYSFSFLSDTGDQRQIPTTRSARSMTLTVADDPSLPQYAVLKAANDDRLPRTVRFQLPGGSAIYFSAYISFSEMPTLTKDQAMSMALTLSLNGQPTRYAGA